MRFNAMIAGVGMTPFGKHIDKGLKALGAEATRAALADAGVEQGEIQAAWVGNAAAGLVQYSIASKVFATNTAFEAASAALQIYGGNGLSREYPIEKLLRDARASMIEDGCNDILSLVGAEKL